MPPDKAATVTINSSQLAPRLGQSLAEMTWEPRGLMFDRYSAAPETLGFRPLDNPLAVDRRIRAISSAASACGLAAMPAANCRSRRWKRSPHCAAPRSSGATRRPILKRTTEGAASADWLTQINDLTAAMDASSAGEILFQLGQSYCRAGQWDSATQVFELLVRNIRSIRWRRPPKSGCCKLTHRALRNTKRRLRAADSTQPDVVPASVPANAISSFTGRISKRHWAPNTPMAQAETDLRSGQPAVRQTGSVPPRAIRRRFLAPQHAIQIAGQIERSQPALFAEPSVRLPLAAAYRRLGMMREAEHTLVGFALRIARCMVVVRRS